MPPDLEMGDSFFGTLPYQGPKHLYVIISKPSAAGEVVIVNVTTKSVNDRDCILYPGDHDFIQEESIVAYIFADMVHVEQIQQAVNAGLWTARPRFRPEILRRIQEGALQSDDLPGKYEKPIRDSLVSVS